MARPPSKHPTELELTILKVLWRRPTATVAEVRQALAPEREQAYTSVMTIMNIMEEKGYLSRVKNGASYVYRARITEQSTTRGMLTDLVSRAFDGSAGAAMLNLLETSDLNPEELGRLRELIDTKLKEEES